MVEFNYDLHDLKNQFKRQLNNIERNEIHRSIKSMFEAGELPQICPAWHENEPDIDLSLQRDKLDPALVRNGFTILRSVDVESLLDRMEEQDGAMFRRKRLYARGTHPLTISSIINDWMHHRKLIPPTILIYDEIFAFLLKKPHIQITKELRPIDGKHRLNVAYYFGAKTVPILVINAQLLSIQQTLNLSV